MIKGVAYLKLRMCEDCNKVIATKDPFFQLDYLTENEERRRNKVFQLCEECGLARGYFKPERYHKEEE